MPRPLQYPHQYTTRYSDDVDMFLRRRSARTGLGLSETIREVLEEAAAADPDAGKPLEPLPGQTNLIDQHNDPGEDTNK